MKHGGVETPRPAARDPATQPSQFAEWGAMNDTGEARIEALAIVKLY